MAAFALRSITITGVVLALSGLRVGWLTDRVSVVYVLDQSDSISPELKQAMVHESVSYQNAGRDTMMRGRITVTQSSQGDEQLVLSETVRAVGALMLVLDTSGSMAGQKPAHSLVVKVVFGSVVKRLPSRSH